MARIKTDSRKDLFGVADGIDFSDSVREEIPEKEALVQKDEKISMEKASADFYTNRSYSKYYTPKPQIGARGGILGRPPIEEDERKIQFSVSCTKGMKELYQRAAKADGKKFPDFINNAIQEYITNHNLQ